MLYLAATVTKDVNFVDNSLLHFPSGLTAKSSQSITQTVNAALKPNHLKHNSGIKYSSYSYISSGAQRRKILLMDHGTKANQLASRSHIKDPVPAYDVTMILLTVGRFSNGFVTSKKFSSAQLRPRRIAGVKHSFKRPIYVLRMSILGSVA